MPNTETRSVKPQLKRGTRVEYTYAFGDAVPGKVLRPYDPDPRWADWFLCELEDEAGKYRGGCHISQLRVTDNRVSA